MKCADSREDRIALCVYAAELQICLVEYKSLLREPLQNNRNIIMFLSILRKRKENLTTS